MGGRHCLVATMKLLLLVFVISSAAALETYTETRDITDSAGSTFSCLYTIVYDVSRKVVYRKQSTVQCNPDTNGKQTTEDIIIAAAGMSVAVTYQPRTGKTGIKKTVVSDYTAPTTTAAPTTAAPAAPAATGAPATGGSSMTMEGVMDCTCMPNMTAMKEDMQSMMDMDMESMMSATGRAIRYVKKVENGQLRVRPVPVVKDMIIGALLISALRSQIQTAITSAISSLITNALGRSLPANKVLRVALRQLFNLGDGGLLGQLAAAPADAASSSGTNIMEEMAMNMAQQQIEQMLSSGELENMAMDFLSSGQMEQMIQEFMASPETEQMMNEMMTEVMRPPTEEEAAMMMSMMEELMKPPTEEEMAEMEQAWTEMMSSMMSEEEMAQMEQAWMDWETQMEAEWKANGGLMGMMGMTGDDMKMMMQMMEMKAHCQCTSSNVAYGQMAMPTMMAPAGRNLAED